MNSLTIWQYWENVPDKIQPKYVDLFYSHNANVCSIHSGRFGFSKIEIIRLTSDSPILSHLFDDPAFLALIPQQRSDIIRVFLLHRFGGLWLDSDILISNPTLFFSNCQKWVASNKIVLPVRLFSLPCNWIIFSPPLMTSMENIYSFQIDLLNKTSDSNALELYTALGSQAFLQYIDQPDFLTYRAIPLFLRVPWNFNGIYLIPDVLGFFSSLLFPYRFSPLININAACFEKLFLDRICEALILRRTGKPVHLFVRSFLGFRVSAQRTILFQLLNRYLRLS